jgi:putative CocE/NonD family hydrolase
MVRRAAAALVGRGGAVAGAFGCMPCPHHAGGTRRRSAAARSATLYVSSPARDANFTAKLVLVRADGEATIVEDGILRARFHRGRSDPRLLVPAEVVPVQIDLGATALTIPAGARLRLEVSGGSFPKYDRNPQTGENPLTASTLARAAHRVHHGAGRPPALTVWLRR